jgi:RimJ/RimL family protein N-acetyltransferase
MIELFASPEVGTYVGGPRARDELERVVPEVPGRRAGFFVVDLDGAMIGTVTLDRRGAERRGHVRPDRAEAELGYMFLPEAWGCGYAAEACAAALDWFASALPGEPVVLCTQTANVRSMRLAAKLGFTEVERFDEYGAEQWFGVWFSSTPPGVSGCTLLERLAAEEVASPAPSVRVTPACTAGASATGNPR